MVNDLKSNPSKRIPEDNQRLMVPFISLARTQALVDLCVSRYIDKHQCRDSHWQRAEAPHRLEEPLLGHVTVDVGNQKNLSPLIPKQGRQQSPSPSPARPPPIPPVARSDQPTNPASPDASRLRSNSATTIFGDLEKYIVSCLNGIECLNASFLIAKPPAPTRAKSETSMVPVLQSLGRGENDGLDVALSSVDAKTLLLGNVAENGTWWTGTCIRSLSNSIMAMSSDSTPRALGSKTCNIPEDVLMSNSPTGGTTAEDSRCHRTIDRTINDKITMKSPLINWKELSAWYHCILNAGRCWKEAEQKIRLRQPDLDELDVYNIEEDFQAAFVHLQRTLLKASENLLRRPGRPLKAPTECRFLLILLANPLLYSQERNNMAASITIQSSTLDARPSLLKAPKSSPSKSSGPSPSQRTGAGGAAATHSGITKRLLGLLSNLPSDCHRHLIAWFSQYSGPFFRRIVDLVGSFVTYRLSRQHSRKLSNSPDPNGGLIPSFSTNGIKSSAQLHAALGISVRKTQEQKTNPLLYGEDWQIRAAAKVMSLLFSANINGSSRRQISEIGVAKPESWTAAHPRANRYGQLLPTNAFYNTLLDYSDLVADFEAWESRRSKFSFCQYPMFLSIWAKIRILEHDARRQMEIKAREAFFDSIMNRKAVSQYMILKVRRDCLVEDSLRGVSEVVGTGQEDIKKGLRIEFKNEEGIDAGGYVCSCNPANPKSLLTHRRLRKEWFLMLVREVFDPEHGTVQLLYVLNCV